MTNGTQILHLNAKLVSTSITPPANLTALLEVENGVLIVATVLSATTAGGRIGSTITVTTSMVPTGRETLVSTMTATSMRVSTPRATTMALSQGSRESTK